MNNTTYNINSLSKDDVTAILESLLFASSVDICASWYKENSLKFLEIAKKIRTSFPEALLENVYNRLIPWIDTHPNHGLYNDSERPVCKNCGSSNIQKRGTERTKTLTYQRWHCQDCGTWQRSNTRINKKEVFV